MPNPFCASVARRDGIQVSSRAFSKREDQKEHDDETHHIDSPIPSRGILDQPPPPPNLLPRLSDHTQAPSPPFLTHVDFPFLHTVGDEPRSVRLGVGEFHTFKGEEDGEVDEPERVAEGEGVEEFVVGEVAIRKVEFDCESRSSQGVRRKERLQGKSEFPSRGQDGPTAGLTLLDNVLLDLGNLLLALALQRLGEILDDQFPIGVFLRSEFFHGREGRAGLVGLVDLGGRGGGGGGSVLHGDIVQLGLFFDLDRV